MTLSDGLVFRKKRDNMSDFNTVSNNDFMIEKIKERPINRKKLIRRTVTTASMAVIFGLVSCFTMLLLEPVIGTYLYPEEEAAAVIFPEDDDEMKPEDMLEEEQPLVEIVPQEPVNAELDDEQVEEILNAVTLDKSHYMQLYSVMSEYVDELSQYMVTVTSVEEDYDWMENSYESTSNTSGVVIAKNVRNIFILTSASTIKKADEIKVSFYNGKKATANLQEKYTELDMAVICVDVQEFGPENAESIQAASLGSLNTVNIQGTPVVAIGSPTGVTESVGYGMITAVIKEVSAVDCNYDVLLTDIHGSKSAQGVLFDMSGRVLGIISSAKVNTDMANIISAYGINDLKTLMSILSEGKQVPYLGIKGISVTDEAKFELQMPDGAYVTDVMMNSPAMLAGLQKGDIIIGLNETLIEDFSDFERALYDTVVGQTLSIKVMRQSQDTFKEMSMDVTLTGAEDIRK